MNNNKFSKLLIPNTKVYLWIIGILVFLLVLHNMYLGIMGVAALLYLMYYNWRTNRERKKKWQNYIESFSSNIDSAARYAILNLPLPLVLVDLDGTVSWYNSKFSELFESNEILEQNIEKLVPAIEIEKMVANDHLEQEIKISDKVFRIIHKVVKIDDTKETERYIIMLYWIEITRYNQLKTLYNDEKSLVAMIQVDNYDDVMNETKEEKRPFVESEIDHKINLWASRMNGLVKKYQKDKFLVIFENKYLANLEAKRFSILDDLRQIEVGNRIPVTLSIGVGTMAKNLSEAEDYAFAALELALGRGGDQAVVRKSGGFDFYGGKTKAVEKRNRVKARIMAHAFRPLIDESSKVFIMGHQFADMDSFGSAIGVYRAVVNRGKDAFIVLDSSNEAIKNIFEEFREDPAYNFITGAEAVETLSEKDLVVVVDTHRPSFTECPELLEMTNRIVLFDHHRRGTEFIENTVLKYLEPYASSTSELITEMLQYMESRVNIEKKEAEALLAGITVDTKNFSFKTGVRTFEAAAFLRRYEADTTAVKQLFQDDLSTFIAKSNIVSNAVVIKDNIALSVNIDPIPNARLIAAQGADALLNIRGINCSFVVGIKEDDVIFISGRSLGDMNVQLILEKIGGGGHLTVAGAQFDDKDIEEVKSLLLNAIDEYLEEGEKK